LRTEVETTITPTIGLRRRLTVFFRPILAIPAIFIVSLVAPTLEGAGALPLLIALVMVLFYSYPAWLIVFSHAMLEFATKTNAYVFLLTDSYPNFNQSTDIKIMLPDIAEGKALNRWLPLIKWLLAIPHYVVIAIATPGVYAIVLYNWIVILITGKYSGTGSKFIIGYISYLNRIAGYAFAMVTDSYPRIITK
jgi:hypothetical protein